MQLRDARRAQTGGHALGRERAAARGEARVGLDQLLVELAKSSLARGVGRARGAQEGERCGGSAQGLVHAVLPRGRAQLRAGVLSQSFLPASWPATE